MENFIFSLGAVTPTFIIILLGYLLKSKKYFNDEFLKYLDKYTFSIALPALMIKDVAEGDIVNLFSFEFAFFCFIVTTFMFFGFYFICYPFIKDKAFLSSFIHATARGSVAVFGSSMAINIYGSAGVTPLMIAVVVPLYNIYTVILFAIKDNDKNTSLWKNIKKTLKNIATNPIIIGILIGIFFALSGIKIPKVLSSPLSSIAATGTPLALLSLGASLRLGNIGKNIKLLLVSAFMKLILICAIFMPIAVMMGMRDGHLIAVLIMTASPSTVTAYVMTKNMGGDAEFTSGTVMVSTLLSTITLTFWLTLLKTLALI